MHGSNLFTSRYLKIDFSIFDLLQVHCWKRDSMKIEDRMARHDDRLRVDIPVSNGDCRGERATFFVSRVKKVEKGFNENRGQNGET